MIISGVFGCVLCPCLEYDVLEVAFSCFLSVVAGDKRRVPVVEGIVSGRAFSPERSWPLVARGASSLGALISSV